MKNTIFLVAMACLLAGCANNTKPDFKVAVQGSEKQTPPLKITTEPNLPVKIDIQSDKGLPVENEALQVSFKPSKANWVAIIIGGLAALFTLLSAGGAWWAAYNTKKAAEGRLFVGLTREYVSDEIGKGIKELDDWWKSEGAAIKAVEAWQKRVNVKVTEEQREKEAEEILKGFGDKSKIISKVAIYFLAILQLYKSGYVSKKFAKRICEITKITGDIEYFMELSIWANGGGDKEVEKFKNELKEIRHIKGA